MMELNFHLYLVFCSFSIISDSCFSERIPAILLKEDVIGKLTAPGDVIGTLINGIPTNMNGTMNIPLIVDLMQSESDWMRPNQKDKSSKNKMKPYKMHNFSNRDRDEDMTQKTQFDSSLGHKSKTEKDILNELKQSLGMMMRKPGNENTYQPKTSWRTPKPVQPKNEKLGEIDVTEPNDYSDDESNDEDDSFGNEETNSLKDLQTLRTPKYTTERSPPTKPRQFMNIKFESKEEKPFSNSVHDNYNVQTKSQKFKGQTPFQKKHHDTMLSIDDILQALDKISTETKHEKNIYDYKEDDKDNRIEVDGDKMLLKNLKNYFGLIALKDKLGIESVSPAIFEEVNSDPINEEELEDSKTNYDGKLLNLKPQHDNDDKSSDSTEDNEFNSFYRNLSNMMMNPKSSDDMSSLLNLIRNIDNYQKSSLNSVSILDSQTNLKSNENIDDWVDSLNEHLHNSVRFDDKSAYTSDQEVHDLLKDSNKQPTQSLNADVENAGKQPLMTGNSMISNDNLKDDQLNHVKGEAKLYPTQSSESSLLANNPNSARNEASHSEREIRESPLHELQPSIRNNEDSQIKVGLGENKSWIVGYPNMASKLTNLHGNLNG